MSETILRAGAGWGATTIDRGANYNGNVGGGGGGWSSVSTSGDARMARLTIVAICLIGFCILSPNYR